LKGLLEAVAEFPTKAIGCGDQSGDGVKDFVVTANPYSQVNKGYVIIFRGRDDLVVSVNDQKENSHPSDFYLEQNYPNPFNPVTTIKYDLPKAGYVELIVYDILGRRVKTLVNQTQQTGRYEIQFNASVNASGIYLYQLRAEDYMDTKKMILLR
jgi:hypothetical protein